jgi:hypothetical protein
VEFGALLGFARHGDFCKFRERTWAGALTRAKWSGSGRREIIPEMNRPGNIRHGRGLQRVAESEIWRFGNLEGFGESLARGQSTGSIEEVGRGWIDVRRDQAQHCCALASSRG